MRLYKTKHYDFSILEKIDDDTYIGDTYNTFLLDMYGVAYVTNNGDVVFDIDYIREYPNGSQVNEIRKQILRNDKLNALLQ